MENVVCFAKCGYQRKDACTRGTITLATLLYREEDGEIVTVVKCSCFVEIPSSEKKEED